MKYLLLKYEQYEYHKKKDLSLKKLMIVSFLAVWCLVICKQTFCVIWLKNHVSFKLKIEVVNRAPV